MMRSCHSRGQVNKLHGMQEHDSAQTGSPTLTQTLARNLKPVEGPQRTSESKSATTQWETGLVLSSVPPGCR